jgi:DNA-nicking Smr family endonuclease
MRKLKMKGNKRHLNKYMDLNEIVRFVPQRELDFHDYPKSLLPYDIEKILNEFLEDSYVSGLKYVLVITGKGQVVRPLVHKYLKENKYVESFKLAGYFNGQSGAVEVTLKN